MKPHLVRTLALVGVLAWSVGCGDSDTESADARVADAALDAAEDAASHDATHPQLDAGQNNDAGPQDASMEAAPMDAGNMHVDPPMDSGAKDAMPHDSGDGDDDDDDDDDAGGGPDPDAGPPDPPADQLTFAMRVVKTGLDAPWEITWGYDGMLWITERVGLNVIRVNPQTGASTLALNVADAYQDAGQDGVLGLALDPRLGQSMGADYVYVAYTYDANAGAPVDRRATIVRYTYSSGAGMLGSPLTLIEGLPASSDHNSGRLAFGPDSKLYYTIGDQGHNQFDNMCLVIRAQDLPSQNEVDAEDWSAYQGKILRLGLDGSIPSDNPMLGGVRSHIYSYGHRNAQGIAFGADGKLYASEHGPKTDDEINLIAAGKNYGWPNIAGYRDDKAYVYGNWSASSPTPCSSLTFSDYGWPSSVPEMTETSWTHPDFVPPLTTFYTVNTGYDFMDAACGGNDFICWPTIAPSSLDYYDPGSSGLQSWGRALLVPTLKKGSVLRVRLNANGDATMGEPTELFKTTNRYRDLTIAPDKRTFYVITDSDGSTSGPTSGSTQQLDHRGAILEFKYVP